MGVGEMDDSGRLKAYLSRVADMVDVVVHVATQLGAYGPAEDAHLIINHAVAALLRAKGE